MKYNGKPRNYDDWNAAEGYLCSLCGKPGSIRFKSSFVCEDCLEYVKSTC